MEKGFTIELPPHGYVRYIDHMGDDTRIVEAARVSYGAGSKGEEADKKLLKYLFINRHTSPFEQCNITFNIKMPIFIMRQFVRHRTFRLNELSARYTDMSDEFFLPDKWRKQDMKNKQSSQIHDDVDFNELATHAAQEAYDKTYKLYRYMIDALGVGKEQARMILPVGLYTEIYINVDLHNLIHFFNLRTDSHAQKEIRDVAWAMVKITENLFPWSIDLWSQYSMAVVSRGEEGDAAKI
jgi:thymidylate synthase (FAD)